MEFEDFDNIIHAPNRLMICAALVTLNEMEFVLLKEQLGVSDSVLSKHIKTLADAGYINLKKNIKDGRQRTWLSLTDTGATAYKKHVEALRRIVEG